MEVGPMELSRVQPETSVPRVFIPAVGTKRHPKKPRNWEPKPTSQRGVSCTKKKHADTVRASCGGSHSPGADEPKAPDREGLDRYVLRKSIFKPPGGQIKETGGFRRFSLRVYQKVQKEWALVLHQIRPEKAHRSDAGRSVREGRARIDWKAEASPSVQFHGHR